MLNTYRNVVTQTVWQVVNARICLAPCCTNGERQTDWQTGGCYRQVVCYCCCCHEMEQKHGYSRPTFELGSRHDSEKLGAWAVSTVETVQLPTRRVKVGVMGRKRSFQGISWNDWAIPLKNSEVPSISVMQYRYANLSDEGAKNWKFCLWKDEHCQKYANMRSEINCIK